jgi:para-nitrobenzyl esterase
MRFGWNMLAWAGLHAQHTLGKAFLYHFEHTPPGERGARHGVEMAYVFSHSNPTWTEADHRLSDLMASYWTNFAKTGNPNGEGLPDWPAFTPALEHALLIGEELRAGELPNRSGLAAIDRLYGAVRFVTGHLVVAGVALTLLMALFVALFVAPLIVLIVSARRALRGHARRRAS